MIMKEKAKKVKTRLFQGAMLLPLRYRLLTLLKELFRRFKISSLIPVRVPRSLKLIGPVKPSVLTC